VATDGNSTQLRVLCLCLIRLNSLCSVAQIQFRLFSVYLQISVAFFCMLCYPLNMETKVNQTEAKRERMLRELMSDLALLVESEDLTDMEANDWYNMKADQWALGLS
jgi:hypothetical protein